MVNGIQALEVRYNWEGTPLTDEDKAVNAATYAKVAAGGEYLLYTIILYGEGKLFAIIQGVPNADYPQLLMVFESDMFSQMGLLSRQMVAITESGDVEGYAMFNTSVNVTLENPISSYQDLYDGFVAQGFMPEMYFGQNVPISLTLTLENGRQLSGNATIHYENGLMSIGIENVAVIFAFENTGFYVTVANPIVSLDDPDNIKYDNKYLFGMSTSFDTFNATINYGEDRYTPISWKTTSIVTDGKVNLAVQFVIYRNGVYETWQVMDDGTTQQLTE